MYQDSNSQVMAARKYTLTSSDLADVTAIVGDIQLLKEEEIYSDKSKVPALYKRYYSLTNPKIVHGSASLNGQKSITFSGFTLLSSNQRVKDVRLTILNLEGQNFFDNELTKPIARGSIFIGGPEIPSIMGFIGNKAMVDDGDYKGQPVRAFLFEGVNATLSEDIGSLVGWQGKNTKDAIGKATQISHPLIAMDALRISVRSGSVSDIGLLSQWLIHPSQPSIVKISAVSLLGEAVSELPKGSDEAGKLLQVISTGWEAEHANSIEATYIRALQGAAEQIKYSNQLEKIKAIANDYQLKEIQKLADEFSNSLRTK